MKRSKFSLSYTKLLTCDMGELVPIGLTEVLPGDSVQQATTLLLRTQPLLAPVYHPVRVRISHYFVPHRLVWENWEPFITGGPDGNNASVFPTTVPFGGVTVGSLADYLGVPTGYAGAVSVLPFRGYQLIWNEYYRDQDLQTPAAVDVRDGNDIITSVVLQNVAWEKDYFTSARPWQQKGPAVTIPLGTAAPVTITPKAGATAPTFQGAGLPAGSGLTWNITTSGIINPAGWSQTVTAAGAGAQWDQPNLQGTADLTAATAVTVSNLRTALALQRFEEARARYGSRYVEYLRYLGVRSSDARLQRPEYLGGGVSTIQFSEVLQTAPGAGSNVGDLKGHGISSVRGNRYRRFFEEHGYVFTLMSVLPKTIYADGLFRHWNRRSRYDFWQRELQHIGQQSILGKEVYAKGAGAENVFGYQDRYDEYRRSESLISGEFRSTLNYWHFARIFASEPALNASFVSAVPPERSFPTPATDVLWVYARHSIQARRMVTREGVSFIQ